MSFLMVCDHCPHVAQCESGQLKCSHYDDEEENEED